MTATRTVVVIYSARPPELLTHAVTRLRGEGLQVILIGPPVKGFQPEHSGADTTLIVPLKVGSVAIDPANPPRRWTPRWASIVARNLWRKYGFGRVQRKLGVGSAWWRALSSSRPARQHLDTADVLTALDPPSVYAVWHAARRNPGAAAINGIQPTLEHFGLG